MASVAPAIGTVAQAQNAMRSAQQRYNQAVHDLVYRPSAAGIVALADAEVALALARGAAQAAEATLGHVLRAAARAPRSAAA